MKKLEEYLKTITPRIQVDKEQKTISYNDKAIFGLNISEAYAKIRSYFQGYEVKRINE